MAVQGAQLDHASAEVIEAQPVFRQWIIGRSLSRCDGRSILLIDEQRGARASTLVLCRHAKVFGGLDTATLDFGALIPPNHFDIAISANGPDFEERWPKHAEG